MKFSKFLLSLLAPVSAIVFSLAVGAVVLLIVGINPLDAYGQMLSFSTDSTSLASTINRAVPLYVSAVAVAIGFQMNLFNIGVEGQYLIAAMFAGWVGTNVVLWGPLHITVIVLAAVIVGAIWAGIAGALKVTRGVNEVISTIMLNFIAFSAIAYLLANRFSVESESLNLSTGKLPPSGRLPDLNWMITMFGFAEPRGVAIPGFLIGAIVIGAVYYILVWRTRFGFDLRISGMNPGSARMSGVNPKKMVFYTMLISGGIAGLVGVSTLVGKLGAYTQDFPRGLGFTGIAVALLGRNHPVGMALGALLFGIMDRAALVLKLEGIPEEIVVIIQGVIVLAVVIAYEIFGRIIAKREVKAAAAALDQLDKGVEVTV
ncbi:MAG: ABC transporter permease [Acidimicrobiia bacterium]|nr:MAG: ABC transporter permease [Acidimicrobiia bacterium]